MAFDLADAIRFTIHRERPDRRPGDRDTPGRRLRGPLVDLEVPWRGRGYATAM